MTHPVDGSAPAVTRSRIATLLPSATEIVYALGRGEDLVGVRIGARAQARSLAGQLRDRLAAVDRAVAGRPRRR